MTKLPVRPAVAARSQIAKLVDTLSFMQEPAPGASQSVRTVIVPPDGEAVAEPPSEGPAEEIEPSRRASGAGDEAERELSRLREELALAIVGRDELMGKLAALGEQSASAAEEEREEALSALRLEHERELAAAEAAADEALRAERASAQQALSSLRANHDEALEAERAKRVEEFEAERSRTAAAIDAERERNQKELEALRARLTEDLEATRAELVAAREQLELTADADKRAEAARAALAAMRDESERQAQVHALTERELRAELDRVRDELDELRDELEMLRALS
jgi:hypothetical protein